MMKPDVIQNGVNLMRSDIFDAFEARKDIPSAELENIYADYPVLSLYDAALDKVVREIPAQKVGAGETVLWLLYNMGYVVKTHLHCFGIDIHHRRAHLLEPFLDFMLVTHNHRDHYNLELLEAMKRNKKKVVSNFYPAEGYSRPPAEYEFGDITVMTAETDHNSMLRQFVTIYLVRCGSSPDAAVIYHAGDSFDLNQLNPRGKIDFFIAHPRIGLDLPGAYRKFTPRCTLISHLWEMGHCPPSAWPPVSLAQAGRQAELIAQSGGKARIPLWGEKIIWRAG